MDDVSLHQEDSGNDPTANQTEDNKNNQTEEEASVQECDPPKRDHLAEDTVEGHGVKSGANTAKAPEQAAGASIGNVEESQPVTDANEVNGEEACKGEEGPSQGADTGETEDPKVVNGEKKGEGENEEDKNRNGQEQGKTKRKSGVSPNTSSPSSVARPRNSARSGRASTKNDIIAKFQQNAPETPVVRNFKLQRSSMAVANGATIKQKVLSWCQNKTRKYEGVSIENFSSSWCDGLAFCALIHRFFPDAFDFSALSSSEREKNFTLAFNTAETMADCCPLLEVGDMILMGNSPDPMCVFTYVQALCQHLSKIEKERKDKEEEEEKSEKMKDGEVETTTEKKEEIEETGKIDGQQEEEDGENEVKYGKEKESEKRSAVEGDEEKESEEREVGGLIEAQA
ncbi:hypothetical protein J4Q44_G00315390 [Coregonus suidteri]|uniref:Calponin-homology (CH) domain-containing protein n=1 Tax=Coregonus suidteri TaxID=861788 RepID=A0AAN8L061_9TELE